jgi:hypothetical protein
VGPTHVSYCIARSGGGVRRRRRLPLPPGSQSEAFKGVSHLAGHHVLLGSSTAIANIIAGYC